MAAADSVLMSDESGNTVSVSPTEAHDYAQIGYAPATPEQQQAFAERQQYSTLGQSAVAAFESAGSALTFGLSSQVEKALGVSPEAMRLREKYNPWASALGTVAGVAAPAVATLGGSLLESAGEFTAPSLISAAGKAVTGGVEAAIPEGTTLAANLARQAAASGLGLSTEAVAYGLGNMIHEDALGDPNITAQSILGESFRNAIVGGALGAFGGAAGAGIKAALRGTLDEYASRAASGLGKTEGIANLSATNAEPTVIGNLIKAKTHEGAARIGLVARDIGILQNPWTDSAGTILDRAQSAKQQFGSQIGDITKQAADAGADTIPWDKIERDVSGPIMSSLRSKGSTIGVADQLNKLLSNFGMAWAPKGELTLEGLSALKSDLGDFIYTNDRIIDPWQKAVNEPMDRIRQHVDQLITDGIQSKLGDSGVAAYRQANEAYGAATTFEHLAESGLKRAAKNNSISLTGTIGAAAGFGAHGAIGAAIGATALNAARFRGASAIGMGASMLGDFLAKEGAPLVSSAAKTATISALEQARAAQAAKIASIASAMVSGGTRVGSAARGEVEAGIASHFGKGADASDAAFNHISGAVRDASSSPQRMQLVLEKTGDGIHEHAPRTTQALHVGLARTAAYLAEYLPPDRRGVFGEALPTSKSAQASFMRRYQAVVDPTRALSHVAKGVAGAEEIDTLRRVYPEMLQQQAYPAIGNQIASHRNSIPYTQQLMISKLFGNPMAAGMDPDSIRALQIAHLGSSQQQNPPKPDMSKITIGERARTGTQANTMRDK